jgi:putative transposase
MEEHPGYEKNGIKPEDTENIRNGTSSKTIKTDLLRQGDVEINIPRGRESSFEPIIVPKHKRLTEKIEMESQCKKLGINLKSIFNYL